MKQNVGPMERYIRLGAGATAALALPFAKSAWSRALLGLVATSGFGTGLTRYCPLNQAFGVNRFSPAFSGRRPGLRVESSVGSVRDASYPHSTALH
jgi:hypothetical protein